MSRGGKQGCRIQIEVKYLFTVKGIRYTPIEPVINMVGRESLEHMMSNWNVRSVICDNEFFDLIEAEKGTATAMRYYGKEFLSEIEINKIKGCLENEIKEQERGKELIRYHANELLNALEHYVRIYPHRIRDKEKLQELRRVVKQIWMI